MKARIYKTSNEACEDLQFEEILRQNSIPYEKYNVDKYSLGYGTDFQHCFYYIYINNLEELLGLQRIFEYRLIIQEDKMLTNDKEEKLLDIEVYNTYRE